MSSMMNRVAPARGKFPYWTILSRSLVGIGLALGLSSAFMARSGAHAQAGRAAVLDASQPTLGTGVPQVGSNAPRSASGSTKPGSVLFFPKYISDASAPNQVNTLITITNTNPRDPVSVRVFFVADDGAVRDLSLSLVGNQSRTLVASKEAQGQTGYVVATAINSQGLPTQFNWLIGNANLRDDRGHEASYNGFAAAKRSGGPVAFNDGATSADLAFDDQAYDRLPKRVAVDNLQNQDPVAGPAQKTDLTLVSPLANLTGGAPGDLTLKGTLYDASGKAAPQEQGGSAVTNANVEQIWPGYDLSIGPGRSGWADFTAAGAAGAAPLIGLALSDGASEPLHSARVMQTLEWLPSFRMTIPTRAPDNPVAESATQDLPAATGGALGAGEARAGSVLIYPRFVSGDSGATQLYLTNTHPTQKARVRVFFTGLADPAAVKDAIYSVPALQTLEINANDMAPNQRGWVMAVAIDNRALPIQFNALIGSAQVNEATGQRASINAIAIGKNDPNPLSRDEGSLTTDLIFDDVNYDRLQAMSAMAFVPSQSDNLTTLGASRPATSLLAPPNTRGAVGVTLYDELLASFGANVPRTETRLNQLRASLTTPAITNTLQPGQHGWMKVFSQTPSITWSLNRATGAFSTTGNGGYRGGISGDGNLHILTLVDTFTLSAPATNPGNHAPVAVAEMIGLQVEARRSGGTILRLDGSASSDPDPDDPLSYQWFDHSLQISTARVADRRFNLGAHTLKLIVVDGSNAESDPDVQTVNIVDTTPPQISGIPSAIAKVTDSDAGEAIAFPLPVAYDMVDGSVPVFASKPSGSVFPLGKTVVTFTARDLSGNVSTATMEVTLTRGIAVAQTGGVAGSVAPVMDNLNDQYVKKGEVRSILLQAADADGDPVTFTVLGAPGYAQIISGDPAARNATLRIAPTASDSAVATNVRIVASDGRGQSFTTLPFRIFLSDVPNDDTGSGVSRNQPPVAVVAPIPATVTATSKDGADITLDASGSADPEGDPMTFAWYDGDLFLAKGPVAVVKLPIGSHQIRLTIFDGKDGVTTPPAIPVEVLPRPLTALSVSPGVLDKGTNVTLTVTGTGFTPGATLQFSKDGISVVNYVSVEEDRIVANVAVSATPVPGFRDIYVFNSTGASVRLRSALFVNR